MGFGREAYKDSGNVAASLNTLGSLILNASINSNQTNQKLHIKRAFLNFQLKRSPHH